MVQPFHLTNTTHNQSVLCSNYVCLFLFVSIAPSKTRTRNVNRNDNITFFFHGENMFSQWYIARFQVDGLTYICAEQYMMHQKAGEQTSCCARKLILNAAGTRCHTFFIYFELPGTMLNISHNWPSCMQDMLNFTRPLSTNYHFVSLIYFVILVSTWTSAHWISLKLNF